MVLSVSDDNRKNFLFFLREGLQSYDQCNGHRIPSLRVSDRHTDRWRSVLVLPLLAGS